MNVYFSIWYSFSLISMLFLWSNFIPMKFDIIHSQMFASNPTPYLFWVSQSLCTKQYYVRTLVDNLGCFDYFYVAYLTQTDKV